jgi:hypothetical protein
VHRLIAVALLVGCTNTSDPLIDVCVESAPTTWTSIVMVGKVPIPITNHGHRCIRWEKQPNPNYRKPGT